MHLPHGHIISTAAPPHPTPAHLSSTTLLPRALACRIQGSAWCWLEGHIRTCDIDLAIASGGTAARLGRTSRERARAAPVANGTRYALRKRFAFVLWCLAFRRGPIQVPHDSSSARFRECPH